MTEARSRIRALIGRGASVAGTALTIAVAAGGVALGTGLIAARAELSADIVAEPPLAVQTAVFRLSDRYAIAARYEGRVEARRQLGIGFEQGGTIVEVLADEGDRVAKGDLLARLDTRALMAERSAQVAARDALVAQLELARLTADRQKTLLERQHASGQRYDEARLQVASLEAELRRAEAAIAAVDVAISKSDITAPFDAVVAARHLDDGVRVAPGQAVLSLLEDRTPEFRLGLPEDIALGLGTGSVLPVTIGGEDYAGRLLRVRPEVDPATRTVSVLLALDGAPHLPEGMLGTMTLDREVRGEGAWVPVDALSEGIRGLWTLFVLEDRAGGAVARRETVELLHVDGDRAYVRGAVPDGARFVVSGSHRLAEGQPVAPRAAEG